MSRSRDSLEDGDAIPRDDLFEILSNRRRRQVIQILAQRADGRAELSEVLSWLGLLAVALLARL